MSLRADISGFAPRAGWSLDTLGDEVAGAGMTGEDVGLRYWADPAVPELRGTGDSTLLRVAAPHVYLHDVCLSNDRGWVKGSGCGIIHDEPVTLWKLLMERVNVLYAGRNCLRLVPAQVPGTKKNYNVSPCLRSCNFYGAGEEGVYVETCNFSEFNHVTSTNHGPLLNPDGSVKAWTRRGFTFINCGTAKLRVAAEDVAGGVLLKDCVGGEIDCSHIESFAGAGGDEPAIVLDNCRGVTVRGCVIEDWSGRNPTGILLKNGTTRCTIEPNVHAGVGFSVDDGGCRGNTIYRQTWPAWHPEVKWSVSARRNRVVG